MSRRGTPIYLSPEMFENKLKKESIFKTDVWSMGVMFFNILFDSFPFKVNNY